MKKTILSLLLMVLSLAITRAQAPINFSSNALICFNAQVPQANVGYAAITQTIIGANYTWSFSPSNGNCTPTYSATSPHGQSISIYYPCCGIYTITCNAIDSSGFHVASISHYVYVSCPTTLTAVSARNNLCSGDSTMLTASGGNSYTWQPGNHVGSNYAVTPSATTCYTVTGGNNGCNSSAVVCVTVQPASISLYTGVNPICPGGTTSLFAGGANSYTWSNGSTSPTIVVSPSVTTCYSVMGTYNGCTAIAARCITVTPANVTINALGGNFNVCPGATAYLYASGATNYTWSTGATTATIAVTPSVTTCYTVTGSGNGCNGTAVRCVTVAPANVTINALSGNFNVCAGTTSYLYASGATNYTWSTGATTATIAVTPSVTTCYTVTGGGNGCNATAVRCITVNPTPVITTNNPIFCAGNSGQLTASGALTYSWYPYNLTGSSIVITPSVSSCYTVVGTNTFGCTNAAVGCFSIVPYNAVSINGNLSICPGGSATLTASGANGYTWVPGPSFGTSIVVSPSVTTCYTVATNINGCNVFAVRCVTVQPSNIVISGPSAICINSTATLTASGSANYTWQPGNHVGASIVVSPTTTTCYTVTGQDTSGICQASPSVKCLAVNPRPVITSTAPLFCAGNPGVLSASGAATYTWYPFNLTGANITLTPSVGTCYTVVGTSSAGCVDGALNCFSVMPTPAVSLSGNFAVCPGSSTTLTASGAASYTWYPGNLTGSTVVVSPSVTTCYTVAGYQFGCTGYAVRCVTVQPSNIVISGPSAICINGTATLTASGSANYTWQPGNHTGASIVVSPTATTCYTVTGNDTLGFCSASAGVKCITVNPRPVITTTAPLFCAGNPGVLSASGAATYTWYPFNLTGANITLTPSVGTCYTVVGTSSAGCVDGALNCFSVMPTPAVSVSGNFAVCAGGSTTLTALGAASYTWYPGGITNATIVATPSVSTCYTVAGYQFGCTGYAVRCVTVSPTNISINGNLSICAGNSATLTASGSSNYTWQPGNLTGSAVVVSPSVSTCYTVTGTNGNGCAGAAVRCLTVQAPPPLMVVGDSSICQNANTTLTAYNALTYTWLPGNLTGSVVVVTPSVSTCYTVVGTAYNGCIGIDNHCIVVGGNSATPTVTISGPAYVCAGGPTTLVASGASNYTWYPGGQTGPVIFISPTVSTCYTVVGTTNSGCSGIGSAVRCIQVTPAPVISITGNSLVCAGNTTTLTASGANSYVWSNGMTGSSIVVTPTAPACYTVAGTTSLGCTGYAAKCFSVVSSISLNITGNQVICRGGLANLNASGATSYVWSNGSTTSYIYVSPPVSTVYTVTGSTGSCSQKRTVGVRVNQLPYVYISTGSPIICAGSNTTLTGVGALTYTWNNVTIAPSIVVSPSVTTMYLLQGSDSLGCVGASTFVISVSPCTGIDAVSKTNSGIFMYPNPANNYVTLQSEVTGSVNYFVSDMLGRELIKGSFTETKNLDLSGYVNGTYIIRFESASGTVYKKLVIEN